MILRGWKEIAAYLGSSVRTVQRWEREGLPVVRVRRTPHGPVLAKSQDIDQWVKGLSGIRDAFRRSSPIRKRAEELRQQCAEARGILGERMSELRSQIELLKQRYPHAS